MSVLVVSGFKVCVRTRKQMAEPKQPRRAGTKLSPARKGWETDTQDCGAPEARHSIPPPVPRLRRSESLVIDVPALPGWAKFGPRPYGPVLVLRLP
jgi:hypothetical protein